MTMNFVPTQMQQHGPNVMMGQQQQNMMGQQQQNDKQNMQIVAESTATSSVNDMNFSMPDQPRLNIPQNVMPQQQQQQQQQQQSYGSYSMMNGMQVPMPQQVPQVQQPQQQQHQNQQQAQLSYNQVHPSHHHLNQQVSNFNPGQQINASKMNHVQNIYQNGTQQVENNSRCSYDQINGANSFGALPADLQQKQQNQQQHNPPGYGTYQPNQLPNTVSVPLQHPQQQMQMNNMQNGQQMQQQGNMAALPAPPQQNNQQAVMVDPNFVQDQNFNQVQVPPPPPPPPGEQKQTSWPGFKPKGSGPPAAGLGKFPCHGCGEFGHFIKDCPKIEPESKKFMFPCHECGQLGHFVKDCPMRQGMIDDQRGKEAAVVRDNMMGPEGDEMFCQPVTNDQQAPEAAGPAPPTDHPDYDPNKPEWKFPCHECNEYGHFIRNCPYLGRPPPGSAMNFPCHECGEYGHYIKDCPYKKNAEGSGKWCGEMSEERVVEEQKPLPKNTKRCESGNLLWISPAFQKEIDEKLADKLTKIMQLNKILDEKLKQKRELLEKNALEEAKKAGLVDENGNTIELQTTGGDVPPLGKEPSPTLGPQQCPDDGSGPPTGLPGTTKMGNQIPPPPPSATHPSSNQWNWCHENQDFGPIGWVKDPTSETWYDSITELYYDNKAMRFMNRDSKIWILNYERGHLDQIMENGRAVPNSVPKPLPSSVQKAYQAPTANEIPQPPMHQPHMGMGMMHDAKRARLY